LLKVTSVTAALTALTMTLAIAAPASAQEAPPMAGSVPVHIDIPAIGTHADIVPLAEDEDGAMQAPSDPDTVGWYQLGVGIGTPGNALLDGHVDWGGRLRVFGLLKRLQPGDTFQIADADGNVFTYSVTWIQLYDANTAPVDDIFEQTSDEEVTLITCGGAFDHAIHMYLSRWVVRAVRV
jgi:LPXTG-site transpeptidase (sortase) family protein